MTDVCVPNEIDQGSQVNILYSSRQYTISHSAKNSNWVNLNITKPVRWLYAPLRECDKHCVFFS